MILNLDQNFKPFNENEFEIEFQNFTFSGGEPHIKIISDIKNLPQITITHRIKTFNDIGLLCMAVDAIKRSNVKLSSLVIPYFPAARQDRIMIKGEPLSVKVYADIINNLGFENVLVFDAHSDVTPALVNNCNAISNHHFIKIVLELIGKKVKIISPDGGALKKIYKLSEFLGGIEVVECSKNRDIKTGKLTCFKIYIDDLKSQDCLIVDDICDGGNTFIGLAKELKNKNAGKLFLAVSHGIFSKGFVELENYFEHIYSTNSFNDLVHICLTQIKLNSELLSY